MTDVNTYLWAVITAGVLALIYAAWKTNWINKQDQGTERMVLIGKSIAEGAMAFLKAEYRILGIFVVVVALLLGIANAGRTDSSALISLSFIAGAFASGLAGFLGMRVATKANNRTTHAARSSLAAALNVAFTGGSVMGLSVVGLGLIGLGSLFIFYQNIFANDYNKVITVISGFSLGASSIALFARVGGGIYTKAADVGADLVGKVEAGIPEDHPLNPATIADNVGDNVGDAAGMGSDVYESYIVTMLASLLIAALIGFPDIVLYPILVGASGIIASIIGAATITSRNVTDVMKPLNVSFYVSAAIAIVLNFVFAYLFLGLSDLTYALFGTTVVGVILVPVIQKITDSFTNSKSKPVKEIAESAKWGYASLTLMGIIHGMRSTGPFMIALVVAIIVSFSLASSFAPDPSQALLYGIFGTSLTAMSMLSLAGIVLSIDAFGPIADNAGGIVEMTGMGEENRKITDHIDAVGNTTKAITKGFAIASAGLAALAMIQAFQYEAAEFFHTTFDYSLTNPAVIVGLLVGGLIPFIITGQLISGVSRAAFTLIDEIRGQFKKDPEILTGKSKPDYAKCVDIATVASIKELWKTASIAVAAPIVLGILLGPTAVAGLLLGAVVTGIFLAYHMVNTGGAWDNAKKLIEMKGERGTEEHKVAIVGDIIGDPYKDTAGPALNTVIKLLSTVSIVFVSAFVAIIAL